MEAIAKKKVFKITAEDNLNLVDKLSDTFVAWANVIDKIQDDNIRAQMDAVYREMIKHTIIMEMDVQWAEGIVKMIQDDNAIHPAIKKHSAAFLNEYNQKYVPQELRA